MAERPTFSPVWHRVRALRPRLRPHVQVTRQHYRGRRWHVVHDPASNQFYRLSPIAHELVAMLDGRRTVEQAWQESLQRHGDEAPTQQEVVELISQLYGSNLLSADATPETEQLLRRGRERRKKKAIQQAIGIMYFRVRIFNPDRIITWCEPILRPLISVWGLALWLVLITIALGGLVGEWDRLRSAFDEAIAPSNWVWLILVFIVTKAWHELGHGVICKRFGGQVPELGIMLLVLFPAPYVDASAAWAFASKWKRIAVGAGGMLFELALAAVAVFIWLRTPQGDLLNQVAFNAMLTASISTILFNANPLMRFDGYYILSDLLEVPNLMGRSMNMIKYLFQKHAYRVEDPRIPSHVPAEQAILITYGVLGLAYRVFLFITITLFVMGKLFAVGLVLAIWTAAAWFLLPLGKFVHWHATSPQVAEFRPRAWATTAVMVGAVLILLGAIPVPDHRRASGVVESARHTGVFFEVAGRVEAAHARPGDFVREGDPILTCRGPDIEAELAKVRARLDELAVLERDAMTGAAPVAPDAVRQAIVPMRRQRDFLQRQVDRLTVRAPHDGIIVGADPAHLIGSHANPGDPVCEVVDIDDLRIIAMLSTTEAAPLNELGEGNYKTEVRRFAEAGRSVPAGQVRILPAALRRLPHPALGYAGGGTIQTDPRDQHGQLAQRQHFYAYIRPDEPVGLPGERVRLRFRVGNRPLLGQWIDRLHKLVQGRVQI